MPWSSKLSAPISLKDGRELVTLKDVAKVFFSLPKNQQNWPTWAYAEELLFAAADGDISAIGEVEDQLGRALVQSRLISLM
jgi:hypothetical protein